MIEAAFFRTVEVKRVLDRAARCAASPLRIHFVSDGEEGPAILIVRPCSITEGIAAIPAGRMALAVARREASILALRRDVVIPFLDPFKLGYVAVHLCSDRRAGYVATFGPYCPSRDAGSLLMDIEIGLATLDIAPPEDLAAFVEDLGYAPPETVATAAEWVAESMRARIAEATEEPMDADMLDEPEGPGTTRKWRGVRTMPDPYQSGAIAMAAASGNSVQARELVRAGLSESRPGARTRLSVRRARCIAIVAATVEASERAGIDTARAWNRFEALTERARAARTDKQLADAAMYTLGAIARKRPAAPRHDPDLDAINHIVLDRITESVTLNEVAKTLGLQPTAITHRLQRKFGLSYSQYVGRIRIDKAKELLRRTKLSVSDVAKRVGIGDPSNFNKLFRKFESMPPVAYRKQFGGKG